MATAFGSEDDLPSSAFNFTPIAASNRSPGLKRTANEALDSSQNSTPINNLRRLAAISQPADRRDAPTLSSSPFRPPSSIPSSIGSRLADRTTNVLQNARNLSRAVGRRPLSSANRLSSGMPTTPHAIRAMEERRRVRMTPSREKRRASGRGVERGSPFDVLRSLAQVISAPAQEPIAEQAEEEEDELTSPASADQTMPPVMDESDESDGIMKPPRISLSMHEMQIEDDDDTGIFRPPEISRLDDEDATMKSVELGRRAELDASVMLGRRGRASDVFGTLDIGKELADDITSRQVGSPSFAVGEQSLFPGLGTDDDTVNLPGLQQNEIPTPMRAAREVDFADSTFRFDIPQDATESGLDANDEEEEEEPDLEQVDTAGEAAVTVPVIDDDADSGPEDFGSPSEADEAEDVIEEDVNVGNFIDDQPEDDLPDENEEDPEIAISRELEEQIRANKANLLRQNKPIIRLKPSSRESTEIIPEPEPEDDGLLAPSPVVQRTSIRRAIPMVTPTTRQPRKRMAKPVITSKLGHTVPSLPAGVIKSLADSFLPHAGKTSKKVKSETVKALSQVTDLYFEYLAQDLDTYSNHADRDVIEEADVIALMKRQRVLGTGAKNMQGNRSAIPGSSKATVFSLAQRFLPRELVSELRMDPPPDERRKKRKRISEGGEFG